MRLSSDSTPDSAVGVFLTVWVSLAGCALEPSSGPSAETTVEERGYLREGDRVLAEAERGDVHRYRLQLASRQAIRLVVGQERADMVVRISDPRDLPLFVFDSPFGRLGPEHVCFVAQSAGSYHVDVGPYGEGGSYALELLSVTDADTEDLACARAANRFVEALEVEDGDRKRTLLRVAAQEWAEGREPFAAAMALRHAAASARAEGRTAEAISDLSRAIGLATEAAHDRLRISVHNRLALAYRDQGDHDLALGQLEEGLALARQVSNSHGVATSLSNLGALEAETGNPHRAIERLAEALEIWRAEEDRGEIARTLDNLAVALGYLDLHDEALDVLSEALHNANGLDSTGRRADLLVSIGWTHYLRGSPRDGLPALRSALNLRRAEDDLPAMAGRSGSTRYGSAGKRFRCRGREVLSGFPLSFQGALSPRSRGHGEQPGVPVGGVGLDLQAPRSQGAVGQSKRGLFTKR